MSLIRKILAIYLRIPVAVTVAIRETSMNFAEIGHNKLSTTPLKYERRSRMTNFIFQQFIVDEYRFFNC